MTTTIFYASQQILDIFNTAPISEASSGPLQSAIRGKIKSLQVGFVNFNINNFNPNSANYPAIDGSVTYLELIDGSKYYFNATGAFWNVQQSQSGLTIEQFDLYVDPYAHDGSYSELGIFGGTTYVEIDAIELDGYFRNNISSYGSSFEFSSTPVIWSGGGSGGGGQPSTPAMFNGKYVMTAEADPTQVELLVGGQPLPNGSVVKVGSQKYFKVSGDSLAFFMIPQTPPAEWGWDASANAAWAVLQGF